MATILDEILANKRAEVERTEAATPLDVLKSMAGYALPRRNFYGAVSVPRRGGPNIIAEVKKASPSVGVLRGDFDAVRIARQYEAAGAVAVSVLTDRKYFAGDLAYIERIKATVSLPALRKDFIVDPYQVHESRAFGADAILLIGEALGLELLVELVSLAGDLDLCVLLEVHERSALINVLSALDVGRRQNVLVGINNRDLKTQTVDLETTERLAQLVPPGTPIVAESGVRTRQDVERLHAAGARALLVGETLMRAPDPGAALRTLLGSA